MESQEEDQTISTTLNTLEKLCERARHLWLSAIDDDAMQTVEKIYQNVWNMNISADNSSGEIDGYQRPMKKPKKDFFSKDVSEEILRRKAGEMLAMVLLQSGRSDEADQILLSIGYQCRIASSILNYQTVSTMELAVKEDEGLPCRIFDNYVDEQELKTLQKVFLDPHGNYWTDHDYSVEPPSPYVSYLLPLRNYKQPFGSGGILSFVLHLKKFLETYFPVKNASYCEMWAHNRPHATGHQFHFDSDNEGCTEIIRNPICSCIIYLTDNIGGPSVITNQRLSSPRLASSGWMVHPATGRLVVFDGNVLHGVIPGKGFIPDESVHRNSLKRRVSVMFAFWRKIRVRDTDSKVGAAKSLPESSTWAQQLRDFPHLETEHCKRHPISISPIPLDHIYVSTKNGKPWTHGMGMPTYEEIFQGF